MLFTLRTCTRNRFAGSIGRDRSKHWSGHFVFRLLSVYRYDFNENKTESRGLLNHGHGSYLTKKKTYRTTESKTSSLRTTLS